jgi:hypothetical protein
MALLRNAVPNKSPTLGGVLELDDDNDPIFPDFVGRDCMDSQGRITGDAAKSSAPFFVIVIGSDFFGFARGGIGLSACLRSLIMLTNYEINSQIQIHGL